MWKEKKLTSPKRQSAIDTNHNSKKFYKILHPDVWIDVWWLLEFMVILNEIANPWHSIYLQLSSESFVFILNLMFWIFVEFRNSCWTFAILRNLKSSALNIFAALPGRSRSVPCDILPERLDTFCPNFCTTLWLLNLLLGQCKI